MVNPQFLTQQKNFFSQFQLDKIYNCKISSTQGNDKVLTKDKISTFGYGFVIKACDDAWPLHFFLKDKQFDESTGEFTLIGHLRYNDPKTEQDKPYFLALEMGSKPENQLKIGYNDKGDWIYIIVRDTVSVQGKYVFDSKVQGHRSPEVYTLNDSSDKKYWSRGPNGEKFFFTIEQKPFGSF